MNPGLLQIRLRWDDPATGERREPILSVPIALGREFAQMPASLREQRVARIMLDSGQVSRFHALIEQDSVGVAIADQNSSNGTFVNGTRQTRSFLTNGDTIQIGPYQISVFLDIQSAATPIGDSTILFHSETDLPVPDATSTPSESTPTAPAARSNFPPPFFQAQQVSMRDLMDTELMVHEFDYAAIGAGLGSFIWVDLLRLCGARLNQVVAIGMEPQPYARYQRLCQNSQIPLHERLRSNSDSCPDNIWGFPSYAFRESWHSFRQGQIGSALKYLWQVFAEPTLAETYTPRSGSVFASIDREAQRIGWQQIFRYGRVLSIRQTNDGRYAIAYSRSTASHREHAFIVSRYLHLATGYPAIQFLPDLQAYREKTGDFKSVVNAYEEHEHVYQKLEQYGGTVLIRGRGIVASRIVQRIYEARKKNPHISLLHLMRSPKPQGNKFGKAQRQVKHHYEFQPFNWPKACWGGEFRAVLESADPQQRSRLLADWGGTTTADRHAWQRIVQEGLNQGWYKIAFGEVERVEQDGQKGTITYIQEKDFKGKTQLEADFIIDATGLDAKVNANPLLEDLVTHYDLPINALGRLSVANDFELVEMRSSGQGRVYAAGAATLGGPHAAVDSFLGLQYAALAAVDSLVSTRAPNLRYLNGLTSLTQWLRWVTNQAPNQP
ncbi:FHA domain-containing protein [Cyanobacteria bacterium FACHB-471]|nr:FHA domain-containing protein [Cyanobacteria bacterium FACHB-471]